MKKVIQWFSLMARLFMMLIRVMTGPKHPKSAE